MNYSVKHVKMSMVVAAIDIIIDKIHKPNNRKSSGKVYTFTPRH
jgi:hypothetical protein